MIKETLKGLSVLFQAIIMVASSAAFVGFILSAPLFSVHFFLSGQLFARHNYRGGLVDYRRLYVQGAVT